MSLFGRTPNELSKDKAVYEDGSMVCPRCSGGIELSERHSLTSYARFIYCQNCGFNKRLADGVVLRKDE
jgi:C4-type Zn-finger protein